MGRKIMIGDKIRWVNDSSEIIYTISDIDTSRPPRLLSTSHGGGDVFVLDQVLFTWVRDGLERSMWTHEYDKLNESLRLGHIELVGSIYLTPRKDIVNFNFI